MIALASVEAAARRYDPIAEAREAGEVAVQAIDRAAAGRPWSPDILFTAARELADARKAHPRLAARLKRIAATWWVRKGQKLS